MNIPFAVFPSLRNFFRLKKIKTGYVDTEFSSSSEKAILTKENFDNDSLPLLQNKFFGEHMGTADVILDKWTVPFWLARFRRSTARRSSWPMFSSIEEEKWEK